MKNIRLFILFLLIISLAFTTDKTRSNYLLPCSTWSIDVNDLDLDGDCDIVVGHTYCYQTDWTGITTMLNDGQSDFQIDTFYLNGQHRALALGQFDDSDTPDLATQTWDGTNSQIAIILNQNFENGDAQIINMLAYIDYIVTGDINDDNYSDVVFASNNDSFWGVMLNDGTGTFLEPIYYPVENSIPSGLECGDIDGNGRDDIVLCGQTIEIFMNYESGFEDVVLQSGTYKSDAFIVDFDDDGDNDILTFAGLPVSITQMYENTEDNLDTIPEHYFYALSKEFFISDFNNDNLPDIIYLLSSDPGCVIWYNQGDFQLADSTFIPVEEYKNSQLQDVCCADMDGNGFNDIVIIRLAQIQIPSNLTILYNDGNGHFVDEPVGIDEANNIAENDPAMNCYPNPFSEELNIEINHDSDVMGIVQIFDLLGRVVYEEEIGLNQELRWNGVDSGGRECDEGVYVVKLVVDGEIIDCEKIIKH